MEVAATYKKVPKPLRKIVILVIGGTILLLGIAMIVLPGPAILVIPLGLLILAVEFRWAKRSLSTVKEKLHAHKLLRKKPFVKIAKLTKKPL